VRESDSDDEGSTLKGNEITRRLEWLPTAKESTGPKSDQTIKNPGQQPLVRSEEKTMVIG